MKILFCALFATATLASAQTVLITEANSNGTGGDFFEIHNYGASPVNLNGWKWTDDEASFNGTKAVTFGNVTIPAGGTIVVVQGTTTITETTFRAAWNNLDPAITVVDVQGPGLGNGDAVVLFNDSGNLAAALNFKGADLTVTQGDTTTTTVPAFTRINDIPSTAGHAGTAAGGTAKVSAIWDPNSGTTNPRYTFASVGVLSSYAQTGDATTIGSPGLIGSGPVGNLPPVFSSSPKIYGGATLSLSTTNFTNTVTATDPNPGQTVTLSVISKPSWVAFDPSNGQVTGTPPEAGEFTMVVRATDNGTPVASTDQTISITVFPFSAPIILNEYNAVSSTNFLGGNSSTVADTYFGRVAGNGGEWFELVVVGDGNAGSTLDLRGWKIDVLGDLGTRTIVLSQDAYWSNVVAGTVLTFTVNNAANGGADTEIHKTSALHTDGRLWSNIWIFDPAFVDQSASTFNNRLGISNSNTQFIIRNPDDDAIFGPAGEGIATGGEPPATANVSSTEVLKLEFDPLPQTNPFFSPYNDGTSSSFGAPNLWSGGSVSQSFEDYIFANSPPQITSQPVTRAYGSYSYAITTSDPNGHSVTLSAPDLPDFLTLTPGSPGTATLANNRALTLADAGFYTIRIVANDGQTANNLTPQVFTLTVFHDAPSVILNEYNAVDAANFLGGPDATSTDTHFGRILGNGGKWFELVVTGNGGPGTVDLRGWSIEIGTSKGGLPFETSDVLTLTQDAAWSAVRSGSILTFVNSNTAGGGLDTEINRRNRSTTLGDSWSNFWMGDTQYLTLSGATIDGNTVTGIRINNDDTQFLIKDADGNIVFGPVGEGIAPLTGIGSDEIFELEGHPTPAVKAFVESDDTVEPPVEGYDDGSSGSTFGSPNEWQFGTGGPTTEQDFTPYINTVTETPFQQWINGFPAVTNKAPGVDFDGDGRSNYEEYVLGGNPGIADGPVAPQTLAHTPSEATWQFAIRDDNTIAYTLKRSTDLAAWLALTAGSNVQSAAHPTLTGFLLITVTTPPTPANGREFFRIELEVPEM